MVSNPHGPVSVSGDTIIGSIDPGDHRDEFVIADISTDGAWISMAASDAPALTAWR